MDNVRDFQTLQSWFTSSFPIGSYNYSHGFETAIQNKEILNMKDVFDWIICCVRNGSGFNDAVIIKSTYEGENVNDIAFALCAGFERYLETKEIGFSFSKIINEIYKISLPNNLAYPVSVGMTAKKIGINLNLTINGYLQSFSSNLISVAVKSIPLGQTDGQKCLYKLLPEINKITKMSISSSISDLGSASNYSDICSLKHETLSTRIYKT